MTIPDINLLDLDVYQRSGPPYEQFAWLREHAPVFWHADGGTPGWPGFWAVTRHVHIQQVSRHPEVFSSARRTSNFYEFTESEVARHRLGILSADPPLHTRLRGLVNRGFTPRMIGLLEDRITEVCRRLLDDATRQGVADFVADIAAPLPVQVIGELVGAPAEDRGRLYELTNLMTGVTDPEVGSGIAGYSQAVRELYAYAARLAEQRRQQPRDDIVTRLLQPDDEKDELTAAEFAVFFNTLIVAGGETTRNAASGGMLAFLQHPEQWNRLLADPALIPRAAEEIVRWVSPINHQRRTAMCDTELGGQNIAEGDKVVMFYTSANRDEDVFADPHEFDISRDPNPHLGFGFGPHFCLGRHLAALELRVLLHAIAEQMPGITLDGEVSRLRSNFINGMKHMPVRVAGNQPLAGPPAETRRPSWATADEG
jgi:cholest-4-en-3-one 26-monooxygenase